MKQAVTDSRFSIFDFRLRVRPVREAAFVINRKSKIEDRKSQPSRRIPAAFPALLLLLFAIRGFAGEPFAPAIAQTRPSARVVIVEDPQATEIFKPNLDKVRRMVARGITELTGKTNAVQAWRSLVSTQDVVGIKVYSAPGPNSGTRPPVVGAVIEGLFSAGLAPKQIIVWDKQYSDLVLAGYLDLSKRYGVRVAGSAQSGYDDKTYYDTALLGNLVWGDFEFGKKADGIGRRSYVSSLVSKEMTKIINISPLLNHNLAGVSGNLYSLAFGSVDNIIRFESDPDRFRNG